MGVEDAGEQGLGYAHTKVEAEGVYHDLGPTSCASIATSFCPPSDFHQLVYNHFYAARNFRKKNSTVKLPAVITWDVDTLSHLEGQDSAQDVESFLMQKPWFFVHDGKRQFSGVERCWLVVLGFLLYLDRRPALPDESALSYQDIKDALAKFKAFLDRLTSAFEYPGAGPVARYGVAQSREAYLYTIIACEPSLVNLFQVVQRLVSPSCARATAVC